MSEHLTAFRHAVYDAVGSTIFLLLADDVECTSFTLNVLMTPSIGPTPLIAADFLTLNAKYPNLYSVLGPDQLLV